MAQLHYGDQEARTQVADVDHSPALPIQEEGYNVPVHHQRNNPLTSDEDIPAFVSTGDENPRSFEHEGAEIQAPPQEGYGKLDETKLGEDAERAFSAASDDKEIMGGKEEPYGGQLPYEASARKDEFMPEEQGYTSLGIEESQGDSNSENSLGMPRTEEDTSIKQTEGFPDVSDRESIAKELEDNPATLDGSIIDAKKGSADFSETNINDISRSRDGPIADEHASKEEEERESAFQVPSSVGEQRDGAVEQQPEGDSGTGQGMIDVQSLQRDYVDLSEGNTNDLKVENRNEEDDQQQPENEAGAMGGTMDAQSLQRDCVDLSEGRSNDLKIDDSYEEDSQRQQTEGESVAGAGVIDVQPLQRNDLDLPEGNRNDLKVDGSDEDIQQQKQPEGDFGTGGGAINVQSLQKDYVDLSEGKTNDLNVDDPTEEDGQQRAQTSQLTTQIRATEDDPKQSYSVDDPKADDIQDSVLPEQARAWHSDHETLGHESFQGEDGKENIEAEGYNNYSGEPDHAIHDAAEVMDDQHENPTPENARIDAAPVLEPREEAEQDMLEQARSSDGADNEQARDLDKQAFTEHTSSPIEQDAGLKLDSREVQIGDGSSEKENGENERESTYTDISGTDDIVKTGHGGESFVQKYNEEKEDPDLDKPADRVDQEEERRPADEHPLDKSLEGDNGGEQGAQTSEGDKEIYAPIEVPDSPSLPQNQGENHTEFVTNSRDGGYGSEADGGQHINEGEQHINEGGQQINDHEGPHKKGVLGKIKQKLTTAFHTSS